MVYERKKITSVIFISAALLFIVLLYFFVYPLYGKYFPKCFFYLFTGFYCPGCGSQRAIVALLHGDILTAMHNNLLGVMVLPFLLYSLIIYCNNLFNKKKRLQKIFYSTLFVRIVFISVILFAVLRNISLYPFTLLAPL